MLFFGRRPFPNDHAVLECVFTRHLPSLGYSTVFVLPPSTPSSQERVGAWNGAPVYVTRQRHPRGARRGPELLREYLRLGRRALAEQRIDFVQARTGPYELLAAARLARQRGLPLVVQYSFPATLSRRRRARASRGWPLLVPLAELEHALTRRLLRRSALTLAISDAMRDAWRADGVARVESFPLGADVEQEPASVTPAALSGECVLYFGSIEPERKLGLLLDAFALVRRRRPAARLVLLGQCADPGLPRRAAELGLTQAVEFVGRVPRPEVAGYLRAAVCSVAPIPPDPIYLISSPTKVLESLAMAVPVVANGEIRDQREVLAASGGGLAPAWEPEAFAAAILELLDDPAAARRRGETGRAWLLEHRDYRVLSRQLAGLYDRYLFEGAAA